MNQIEFTHVNTKSHRFLEYIQEGTTRFHYLLTEEEKDMALKPFTLVDDTAIRKTDNRLQVLARLVNNPTYSSDHYKVVFDGTIDDFNTVFLPGLVSSSKSTINVRFVEDQCHVSIDRKRENSFLELAHRVKKQKQTGQVFAGNDDKTNTFLLLARAHPEDFHGLIIFENGDQYQFEYSPQLDALGSYLIFPGKTSSDEVKVAFNKTLRQLDNFIIQKTLIRRVNDEICLASHGYQDRISETFTELPHFSLKGAILPIQENFIVPEGIDLTTSMLNHEVGVYTSYNDPAGLEDILSTLFRFDFLVLEIEGKYIPLIPKHTQGLLTDQRVLLLKSSIMLQHGPNHQRFTLYLDR